jgi:hypothetical protein
MLRYAIVLRVAVAVTGAFSTHVAWAAHSDKLSTIQAIKACRAELGQKGKYLQVRRCVTQKRISTVQAINICRAELGKHTKYLVVRKCAVRRMKGG